MTIVGGAGKGSARPAHNIRQALVSTKACMFLKLWLIFCFEEVLFVLEILVFEVICIEGL